MNKLFSLLFNPTIITLFLLLAHACNVAADSLWKDSSAHPISMFSDKKAHAIGDTLTVIIQENNGATRNNSTSTAKKVSQDASISSFLYGPGASGLLMKGGQYPALKYGNANTFDGSVTIANSETINAQLAV